MSTIRFVGLGLSPIRPGRQGRRPTVVGHALAGRPVPGCCVDLAEKAAAKELPCLSLQDLQSTVLELWRGAGFREECYAAIDLTGLRLAAGEMEHAAGL